VTALVAPRPGITHCAIVLVVARHRIERITVKSTLQTMSVKDSGSGCGIPLGDAKPAFAPPPSRPVVSSALVVDDLRDRGNGDCKMKAFRTMSTDEKSCARFLSRVQWRDAPPAIGNDAVVALSALVGNVCSAVLGSAAAASETAPSEIHISKVRGLRLVVPSSRLRIAPRRSHRTLCVPCITAVALPRRIAIRCMSLLARCNRSSR
jgi:hypothetical protein